MRVDWQQELEGCSLLEIRNMLLKLEYADTPFTIEFIARQLHQNPRIATFQRARRLVNGLVASGIARKDPSPKRGQGSLS